MRAQLNGLKQTSFFWRCLKKESFAPDMFKESVAMAYITKPLYWIRSHISFSLNLPQIGLFIAIFIFSFYNPVVADTHYAKFRLGLLFLPVLLIAGILITGARFPQVTPFDLPLFLLLLTAVLSLRRVADVPQLFLGLRELMSLCIFIMSIYLVIYIFTKRDIKKIFYVLGLGGLAASALFIFHAIFLKDAGPYLRNTFGNTNHLGYFLVLVYPIALAISLGNTGKAKHFWRSGVVLIVAGIFFTFSLGAWLCFFLSLPVLTISFKKKWPLIFAAMLVIIFISCPFIRNRFLEEVSIVDPGSTIMARIEVWEEALANIYEKPVLGVGLGQFAASAKPYYAKQMYNAFSVFFHLAATTGIFGLGLFLWFLIRAFKLNISLLRTNRLYGASLLTSLTAGVIGFFWDTHLLAIMTNWLLGMLWGSSLVLARQA